MSEINRRELIKKLSWHCLICNYFEERGKGTLCGQKPPEIINGKIVEYDECIFCRNSSPSPGAPSRVGLKHSVFRPLGLTAKQCQNWGPHQLFMYLYYPTLNWQPPPLPEYDNYGNPVNQETARQTIHHINNDHNDNRRDNITWHIDSDHTRNGQLLKKMRDLKIETAKKDARALGIKIPKKKMDRR
jgi:hypothetical protein